MAAWLTGVVSKTGEFLQQMDQVAADQLQGRGTKSRLDNARIINEDELLGADFVAELAITSVDTTEKSGDTVDGNFSISVLKYTLKRINTTPPPLPSPCFPPHTLISPHFHPININSFLLSLSLSLYIYIYIYAYMCICLFARVCTRFIIIKIQNQSRNRSMKPKPRFFEIKLLRNKL